MHQNRAGLAVVSALGTSPAKTLVLEERPGYTIVGAFVMAQRHMEIEGEIVVDSCGVYAWGISSILTMQCVAG